MKYIGQRVNRVDGIKKVTGDLKYVDDIKMPGMLYAAVKRSPYPHAKILSIDISKAEKLPGVKAVTIGQDFPKRVGLYLADKTFLAVDKVRYRGEAVAAVAAETVEIAAEAVKLIEVEYEELEPVTDAIEAMKPGAPLVHPELGDYTHAPIFHTVPGTNISEHFKLRKGNAEEAFKQADYVLESSFYVPHIQHCPIENHVAIAKYDRDGSLTVWASCQSPYAVRGALSAAFGIPLNKLRVISPAVGGGFGAKAGTTLEGIVIPLSMKTGRPVKLTYSREDEFCNSYVRQAMHSKFKTGVTKDGKIVAEEIEFVWDGGAFTEYGVNITKSAGFAMAGPYEVPNIHGDSYCVYTNHPVGGPYRGFGMAEIHFCIEQNMDTVANAIGMDPIEFRKLNAHKPGGKTATSAPVYDNCGLVECIDRVAKDIDYYTPSEQPSDSKKIRAKGIACGMKAPSMPNDVASSAVIRLNEDGTAYLQVSAQDIGQGSDTALTQIAAEMLSIPPEKITINTGDTANQPYEWQTVASRITFCAGNAIVKAAEDVKRQLIELASIKLSTYPRDLKLEDGHVVSTQYPDKKVSYAELALGLTMPDGSGVHGPIIGRGSFIPENVKNFDLETGQGDKPVAFWTYGANAAEIEVDTETGHIKVLKVSACWDVGKVINPTLIEGQVEGAIVQGLGSALFEEIKLDKGKFLNQSFMDYKIPAVGDMPEMMVSFVENEQHDGPFGARGMAEPAMIPSAPAIANALYNAIGVRMHQIPLTPERVLKAIKEKTNK
ncbi:xanthine dehydrogenase family protein molybdopterin-binding subunit [Proteiniborus sp. MB09-C3]|uniref:xanthine dehydrogenase family protein molybdopterin-binding subunit n=1 Tax=Proteiniborus sp. MB09-C3 TaxID=3050072 RepID=UPI00255600BE|nr:xanthine dehydrogenase family protein molybdopterin-binding subunit [Proteiniborus sp. MB09-C3]WIV11691.1 xanthine dehydrogenase family protein molybdopterin-binding subunit [Proteiniborus sp. MB09-C3]